MVSVFSDRLGNSRGRVMLDQPHRAQPAAAPDGWATTAVRVGQKNSGVHERHLPFSNFLSLQVNGF